MSPESTHVEHTAHNEHAHHPKAGQPNMIWLIPILAVLLIFGFDLFRWYMIGNSTEMERDLWTTPFVPAESPYSTGPESR